MLYAKTAQKNHRVIITNDCKQFFLYYTLTKTKVDGKRLPHNIVYITCTIGLNGISKELRSRQFYGVVFFQHTINVLNKYMCIYIFGKIMCVSYFLNSFRKNGSCKSHKLSERKFVLQICVFMVGFRDREKFCIYWSFPKIVKKVSE